ncbi:hypothetical protein V1517DRAFT_311407 [Lipomyces orientalis]|uniref:Uncharacterized protein n=1 Tax=Lipomyces orientalis TaxID=1233043 RepID=A0ACC3U018_9ASCO
MEKCDRIETITVFDYLTTAAKLDVSDDGPMLLLSATSSVSEINSTAATATSFIDLSGCYEYPTDFLENALEQDEFDWTFLSMVSATPAALAESDLADESSHISGDDLNDGSAPAIIAMEAAGYRHPAVLASTAVDRAPQLSGIDPRLGVLSPFHSDHESSTSLNGITSPRELQQESSLLTPDSSPDHRISTSLSPASQDVQDTSVVNTNVDERLHPDGRWSPIRSRRKKSAKTKKPRQKGYSRHISFNKRADAHPLLLLGDRLDQFLSVEYPSRIDFDKWAHLIIYHDSGRSYPNYCKLFGDVFGTSQLDDRFEKHIAAISRYYVVDMSDVDDDFTDKDLQRSNQDGEMLSTLDRSIMDFTLSYLFPDRKKHLDILLSPIPYFVVRSNQNGSSVGLTGMRLAESPKRPLNVHRLFATAALHQVMRNSASADARMVSTAKIQSAIALIWRRIQPELRSLLILMQQESTALHASIFPDYKYSPNRSKQKRKADAME